MIKVIYFNQWFSSISWVIEDLKKRNKNEVKIIASSRNKDHVYKKYVDEFIVEDWEETESHEESMKNYLDWCINICEKYHVDYFFAKKHMKTLSKNRTEFWLRGTMLICERIENLNRLDYKSKVYEELNETELKKYIPNFFIGNNIKETIEYLDSHRNKNDICLKLDKDEGGASFRAINDSRQTIESLHSFRVNTLTTQEALNLAVLSNNRLNDILFMELLDSPEISVDCYNSKNGFIAICRKKEVGRVQKIYCDKYISNICEEIAKHFSLQFQFNVQFRYKHRDNGKHSRRDLRLLEINPRISGGLYYETSVGINIADACLKDLMNINERYSIDEFINFKSKKVAHIELPVNI